MIVAGTFFIASKEVFQKGSGKSIILALIIGIIISSYTIVDKIAVKTITPFFLISIMNLLPPLFLAPILLTKFKSSTLKVFKESNWQD